MTVTQHEPQDDRLTRMEDVLKQHDMDWHTVAVFAKQRDRESQRKRKKVLRMLSTVRETIPEIKDYLSMADLAEIQSSVEKIAKVIESLAKVPE